MKQRKLAAWLKAGRKITQSQAKKMFKIANLTATIYDCKRAGLIKKYKCESGTYFIG